MGKPGRYQCRIEVGFTEEEYKVLSEKAKKVGLAKATFLRRAGNGAVISELPGADVPMLIREVRRVGNILGQILEMAKARGLIEEADCRKALEENRALELKIAGAYGL